MTEISPRAEASSFLDRADYDEPSVFLAENMLREARRQRELPAGTVPDVCLLDPDGDIVRYLIREQRAERSASWACYHTELWETTIDTVRTGIVGGAVGASFAVLVAEELVASGCRFLVSIASAGKVAPEPELPAVVLIDRALRGEGTSAAYLPPAPMVAADQALIDRVSHCLDRIGLPYVCGTTWTTDAPFRETATALARARAAGASVVEMEAAALYAFGEATGHAVICFAHVTNAMAVSDNDFEKGPGDGAVQALEVIAVAAGGWESMERR
jgi:uridine phosphorylase